MVDWLPVVPNREWEIVLYDENITKMEDMDFIFSEKYNRKPYPEFDVNIDAKWNEICSQNNRLFNGTKFRLDSVTYTNDGKPKIQVGVTDYKTYLCTNQTPSIQKLYEHGKKIYNNKQACLADPISVNVALITADGYIVLNKRADWVGECKGMLDVPGGHAEPEELSKKHGVDATSSIYEIEGKYVSHEIFYSMVREIRDELNLPEDCISWPSFLGIVTNTSIGCRPNFVFQASCTLNKCEIERLYKQGGLETDESTELMFIPNKDFQLENQENDLTVLVNTMSPCGQAALYFYYFSNKSS